MKPLTKRIPPSGFCQFRDTHIFASQNGEIFSTGKGLLKGSVDSYGYRVISLRKNLSMKAHRIISEVFMGVCPPDKVVNHINGIKLDNRLENLEYVTPRDNSRHARLLGLYRSGRENGNSKLLPVEIEQIRACSNIGLSSYQIGKAFNVSANTVQSIVKNKTRISG